MGIDEAINVLKNTAWLGNAEDLDRVTYAIAVAEWCMKNSRRDYEQHGFERRDDD